MPRMTKAGYVPPKAAAPKAEPPKPHKAKPSKKKKKKRGLNAAAVVSLIIFLIAALVGAGTLYVYTKTQPYLYAFVPGTMLSGYPLGGATQEDAQALLAQLTDERLAAWQFEIICDAQTYTLGAQDVGLSVDVQATLDPLWAAGRSGGMLTRYLDMMKLQREPMIMQPVLIYEMEPVHALLEIIRADVECLPADAKVSFVPGSASPFQYTEETIGMALDVSGVAQTVEQAIVSLEPGSLTLEPDPIEPAVYQAVLENAIRLRGRLTVPLEGGEATLANVRLAAKALNGLTVGTGETLSFNESVGKRTAENGYLDAPEPAYGEEVSGVGGGVCQVSTALYRAALLAGYSVSERSAAARPVSYCPMGQEAAVSDQGLDLVIVNEDEIPLFVMARVYVDEKQTFLEITLFGEANKARYALESQTEDLGLIEEPVYVRDREGLYATYDDERVPVGEALPGYRAEVCRLTLDEAGGETGRELISQDEYEAVPPAIYVGVEKREE